MDIWIKKSGLKFILSKVFSSGLLSEPEYQVCEEQIPSSPLPPPHKTNETQRVQLATKSGCFRELKKKALLKLSKWIDII